MLDWDLINAYKELYKPGTRIKLNYMYDDPQPIKPGTIGTVDYVDDSGHIHMIWDNGRGLALIPDIDDFDIIEE